MIIELLHKSVILLVACAKYANSFQDTYVSHALQYIRPLHDAMADYDEARLLASTATKIWCFPDLGK